MRLSLFLFAMFCFYSCSEEVAESSAPKVHEVELEVLGIMQDAGLPHAACKKSCCREAFGNKALHQEVVCLGLSDFRNNQYYLFDASPDLPSQMEKLTRDRGEQFKKTPEGIFITHAHIGHYAGLMYLGRESMNAHKAPVYVMPRMRSFLENNGPWKQLVEIENIELKELFEDESIHLYHPLKVTPFLVPHRDEYSETVGFKIEGPNKRALFIPDIDKWEKWNRDISSEIAKVDYAFLDATFFDGEEVKRDISEIPHPFVVESMELFDDLPSKEKEKVYFIHLNHTNPLARKDSKQSKEVISRGFNIARKGMKFPL